MNKSADYFLDISISFPVIAVLILAFAAHLFAQELEVKVGKPVLVTSAKGTGGRVSNFPSIAKLPTGELIVFFGSCADETQPEREFGGFCISKDGGKTWSRRINRTLWMASHIVLDDGRLLVLDYHVWTAKKDDPRNFVSYAHFYSDGFDKEEVRAIKIRLDRDYFLKWSSLSRNKLLTPIGKLAYQIGPSINNAIVKAKDGSLLATAYGMFTDDKRDYMDIKGYELFKSVAYRSFLLQSKDNGLTWNYYSTISTWQDVEHLNPPSTAWTIEGPNETALVRLADGRLLAYCRAGGQTYSSDDGKTWSKPVSYVLDTGGRTLPFLAVGCQPRLLTLSNGMLALAGGGGHEKYPGRQNLVMFSADGAGEKWTNHTLLGGPTKITTGYPDMVEAEPNKILYVYDDNGGTELWCVPIEVKLKSQD